MSDYGNGIDLDQEMDIRIDRTGNIALNEGRSQLEQDLAYKTKIVLDGVGANPFTSGGKEDIKITVQRVLRMDPRVESLTAVGVAVPDASGGTIEVSVEGQAEDGVFAFTETAQ